MPAASETVEKVFSTVFAESKGRFRRVCGPLQRTLSPQAPYLLLPPPCGESSLTPLRLLSPHEPLRWVRAGAPSRVRRTTRTFVGREVFSPTHMSPEKIF